MVKTAKLFEQDDGTLTVEVEMSDGTVRVLTERAPPPTRSEQWRKLQDEQRRRERERVVVDLDWD